MYALYMTVIASMPGVVLPAVICLPGNPFKPFGLLFQERV